MKNRFRGIVILALFAAHLLLFYGQGWAASVPAVSALNIPSEYGSIREIFEAQGNEQVIIHLQDAHCNYEAQKNMAQLLDYLVKEYGLRLIMVEGGSGDVSLSFLRGYADKKDREAIADKYLKIGDISGEEYLDISSDYDLELYGIEDKGLYDIHLSAFRRMQPIREQGLGYLKELSRVIEALKPYIYSQQLRQLEVKKKQYKDKEASLLEYCRYLKQMANKKGLGIKDYSHLSAFLETARLEEDIDFNQAESERNKFIKDLAGLLNQEQVRELISKSQEFKSGGTAPQIYYSFLTSLAEKRLDLKRDYPLLDSYIRYISVSKQIDVRGLLKEVDLLEQETKEAFFDNSEQRRLSEISKSLDILRRLLNLDLIPEDYEYFYINRSKFLTASWIDFLTQGSIKYNLALRPYQSMIIDENLDKLEYFYQLGEYREKIFIRKLVDKMKASGERLAVLITGGFHTPGITRMLKDKGYSYVVVAPVITRDSDSKSIYFSVLKGEK